MNIPRIGDYVLAATCPEGCTKDPWFVGFYAGMIKEGLLPNMKPRYLVVDNDMHAQRPSGYRRIHKISATRGGSGFWIIAMRSSNQTRACFILHGAGWKSREQRDY